MGSTTGSVLVHRSSTRKKSCRSCIKAKRRCDLILPTCARCRARKQRCIYEEAGEAAVLSDPPPPQTMSPTTNNIQEHSQAIEESSSGASSNTSRETSTEISLTGTSCTRSNDIDPSILFYLFANPRQAVSSNPPVFLEMSPFRIGYCVSNLRIWLSSFVLQNHTPFIHQFSYDIDPPSAYQDALSVCSLYLHRTPDNNDLVFRILDRKLLALICASPSWVRIQVSLLGLQALLLYQIIRLFDSDPQQRANAERSFPLLDNWTVLLHQEYCQAAAVVSNESYDDWILLESVRRTLMMSVVIRDLVSVLKTGAFQLMPMMCLLPLSKKGKMWDADRQEWRESRYTNELLTYGELTQAWNDGIVKEAEVDNYEKLLLVACKRAKGTDHLYVSKYT